MTATIHRLSKTESPSLDPMIALVAGGMNQVNAVILDRMQSQIPLIPELSGHLIASGGAAGTTNKIVYTKGVPANGSVQLWELFGAAASGTILQAFADAGSAVNLRVAGYEYVA